MSEIHIRNEDDGIAIDFLTTALHITIYHKLHGPLTVGAFSGNGNVHLFISQAPLHEGRCESIYRSSGIQLLSRSKGDGVRGFLCGHRICPDDVSLAVFDQEGQVLFQLLQ